MSLTPLLLSATEMIFPLSQDSTPAIHSVRPLRSNSCIILPKTQISTDGVSFATPV